MQLDEFGKIAAAEIAFYVPVALLAFFVAYKHGFTRRQGWVFLFTFSIFRIVGAILTLVYRTQSVPSTGLVIAATILTGIGLSPLLLATHGFVSKVAAYGVPAESATPLRLARILLVVALVLGIVAGNMSSPGNSQSSISTGRTLSRVTSLVFLGVFVILFLIHLRLWMVKDRIPEHHRTLLTGISLALPFLLVRLIYSILGAFASSTQSRFSPVVGDWRIYLGMSLAMEYIVVLSYGTAGIFTPLQKDEEMSARGQGMEMHMERGYRTQQSYERVPRVET